MERSACTNRLKQALSQGGSPGPQKVAERKCTAEWEVAIQGNSGRMLVLVGLAYRTRMEDHLVHP